VPTVSWRANFICTVGAALVASSLSLAFGASGAQAAPKGDNRTVKIHNSATAVTDPRDEPHVCVFTLMPSALTRASPCLGRLSRGRRPVTAPLSTKAC
jgi:hypothetical protein